MSAPRIALVCRATPLSGTSSKSINPTQSEAPTVTLSPAEDAQLVRVLVVGSDPRSSSFPNAPLLESHIQGHFGAPVAFTFANTNSKAPQYRRTFPSQCWRLSTFHAVVICGANRFSWFTHGDSDGFIRYLSCRLTAFGGVAPILTWLETAAFASTFPGDEPFLRAADPGRPPDPEWPLHNRLRHDMAYVPFSFYRRNVCGLDTAVADLAGRLYDAAFSQSDFERVASILQRASSPSPAIFYHAHCTGLDGIAAARIQRAMRAQWARRSVAAAILAASGSADDSESVTAATAITRTARDARRTAPVEGNAATVTRVSRSLEAPGCVPTRAMMTRVAYTHPDVQRAGVESGGGADLGETGANGLPLASQDGDDETADHNGSTPSQHSPLSGFNRQGGVHGVPRNGPPALRTPGGGEMGAVASDVASDVATGAGDPAARSFTPRGDGADEGEESPVPSLRFKRAIFTLQSRVSALPPAVSEVLMDLNTDESLRYWPAPDSCGLGMWRDRLYSAALCIQHAFRRHRASGSLALLILPSGSIPRSSATPPLTLADLGEQWQQEFEALEAAQPQPPRTQSATSPSPCSRRAAALSSTSMASE